MYFHFSSQLWLHSQGQAHAQLVCILSVAFWSAFRTVCCDAPNGETLDEKQRHFVWSYTANSSKLPHLNLISPAPAEDAEQTRSACRPCMMQVFTEGNYGNSCHTAQRWCRHGKDVSRVGSERVWMAVFTPIIHLWAHDFPFGRVEELRLWYSFKREEETDSGNILIRRLEDGAPREPLVICICFALQEMSGCNSAKSHSPSPQ